MLQRNEACLYVFSVLLHTNYDAHQGALLQMNVFTQFLLTYSFIL